MFYMLNLSAGTFTYYPKNTDLFVQTYKTNRYQLFFIKTY